MTVSMLVLLAIVATATTTDLLKHRISNKLVVVGLVSGLLLQIASGVGPGPIALSIIVPFLILLPFYAGGGMAAGDVKLMAACGALLGWPDALMATGATLVVGSVLGIAVFLTRGGVTALLARYGFAVVAFVRTGQLFLDAPEPGTIAKARFPYALAIALGSLSAPFIADAF